MCSAKQNEGKIFSDVKKGSKGNDPRECSKKFTIEGPKL